MRYALRILSTYLLSPLAGGLPVLRAQGFRRWVLRLSGAEIKPSALVASRISILGSNVQIGDGSYLGHNLKIYGSPDSIVRIGSSVSVGPEVVILAGTHVIGSREQRAGSGLAATVTIGDGCWIGGRSTIVGDCQIGAGSVIGAGEVVRRDVPPNSLYIGGSSRPLREPS